MPAASIASLSRSSLSRIVAVACLRLATSALSAGLGPLGAGRKAGQRRADEEHRHEQERLVLIALVREWAVPRRRSPDGETDEQKCDGSRIARPPAQSCPEQRSHGQEAQRGLACN